MKKYFFISIFVLFLGLAVQASSTDVNFTSDTNFQEITLDSSTTTLTILASSTAESISLNSGVFSVVYPGTDFKITCSDSGTKSFKTVTSPSGTVTCTTNTTPGTTYVQLTSVDETYTITPLSLTLDSRATAFNSSCGASSCSVGYSVTGSGAGAICTACDVIAGATAYNSSCQATACEAGRTLSSGQCLVNSSGGGGGGGGSNNNQTGTFQVYSSTTTPDGTNNTGQETIVKKDGKIIGVDNETKLKLSNNPTEEQSVNLNSSPFSLIQKVILAIPKELQSELVSQFGKDILVDVNLSTKKAIDSQKTNSARGGKFLVSFDIFSFNLSVDNTPVKQFKNPVIIKFNITNVPYKNKLKIYYFNESSKKWEMAGDGGTLSDDGKFLIATLDHFTDFGIMRENTNITVKEVISEDALHWQQIQAEALLIKKTNKATPKQISEFKKKFNSLITKNLSGQALDSIISFVNNGTKTTKYLSIQDRANVLGSYKTAFGKLPISEKDWTDVIAITNGRVPNQKSVNMETNAKTIFAKIYGRKINTKVAKENLALATISYGLKITRNPNSKLEASSIRKFKQIYKKNPSSFTDWNIIHALSYVGVKK